MTSMLDQLCGSHPKPLPMSEPTTTNMPSNGTISTETEEEKLDRVCKVLAASAAGLAILSEDLNRSVLRGARPDEDTRKRRTNQIATLNRNIFLAGQQSRKWQTKVEMREVGQEVNKKIDDMFPRQSVASKVSRQCKDVFEFTHDFQENYLYVDPDLRLVDATEAINLRKRRIDFTLSSVERLERLSDRRNLKRKISLGVVEQGIAKLQERVKRFKDI